MKIKSAPKAGRYTKAITVWIAALLGLHLLGVLLSHVRPDTWNQAVALFDLDREYNIPTVTNALLLLSSGVVALKLFILSKNNVRRLGWLVTSFIFFYFSVDELFILHEQIAEPVRKLMGIGNSNPLYHAWVVPALFIISILVAVTWFIHHYYKELRVFAGVLKLIVILASGVVFLEIAGTFVYEYTLFYRLVMIPLEEIYELTMAAVILRYLVKQVTIKQ